MESLPVNPAVFLQHLSLADDKALKIKACHRGRPPGWSCPTRILGEHLLWYFVYGGLDGAVAGKRVQIRAGQVLWINAHTPMRFYTPEKFKEIENYSIRFSLSDKKHPLVLTDPILKFSYAQGLRRIFDDLWINHSYPGRLGFLRGKALLLSLLTQALGEKQTPSAKGGGFTHRDLQLMKTHVKSRWAKQPGAAELARLTGLSTDYFTRRFSAQFGISPRGWLAQEKMKEAAFWLEQSQLSLKEISYKLGFRDQRAFSKQFRQFYGQTPSAYRKRSYL